MTEKSFRVENSFSARMRSSKRDREKKWREAEQKENKNIVKNAKIFSTRKQKR